MGPVSHSMGMNSQIRKRAWIKTIEGTHHPKAKDGLNSDPQFEQINCKEVSLQHVGEIDSRPVFWGILKLCSWY